MFFGLLVGVIMGSLLSLLCVYYGLDQIVVGFGLWFVMEGLAGFLYGTLASGVKVTERPLLVLGLDPVLYLSLALFPLAYYVINRTGPGITLVSVGENPRVADTAGVDVTRVRWICTALGSGLISLAGAYLSLVILQGFTDRLVAGYGWAAFALVLFSRWSVSWLLGGSLFFTVLVGLQIRLQVAGFQLLPSEFMVIIPHMGVIVALVLAGMMGKRMGMPSGLGRHYSRE